MRRTGLAQQGELIALLLLNMSWFSSIEQDDGHTVIFDILRRHAER